MGLRKRQRETVIEAILRAASAEGAMQLRITGVVGLNWVQWRDIIPMLINAGLLIKKDEKNIYVTTDKGIEWLHLRDRMNELLVA